MLRRLKTLYVGCAVISFTIELLFWLTLFGLVVATGIIKLPILSDIAFRPPPAPTPAQADPQVARRLEQRVDSTLRQGGPFTLEITEGEINSLLASLGGSDAPVKDPVVRLSQGKGELYGVLRPANAPFRVTFNILLERGQPRLKITNLNLGVVPLPGSAADLISDLVNDQLRSATQEMPLSLQKIELLPGKLVISGAPPRG